MFELGRYEESTRDCRTAERLCEGKSEYDSIAMKCKNRLVRSLFYSNHLEECTTLFDSLKNAGTLDPTLSYIENLLKENAKDEDKVRSNDYMGSKLADDGG